MNPINKNTNVYDSDTEDKEWLYDTFFDTDWCDEYYGEEDEEDDEES